METLTYFEQLNGNKAQISYGKLWQFLEAGYQNFFEYIFNAIYADGVNEEAFNQAGIVLTGGGAQIFGIEQWLYDQYCINTRCGTIIGKEK